MITKKTLFKNPTYIEINRSVLYVFCTLLLISTFGSGYAFGKNNTVVAPVTAPSPQAAVPAEGQPAQQNLEAVPPVTDADHIRGSKTAQVVVVEYSDFQCPYCQRFHTSMQQVFKDYGGKIAWVLRSYPLSFHDKAQKIAEASECVADLGGNDAYWKMADNIFTSMPNTQLTDLGDLAQNSGVNKVKFQECLDSGKFADKVKKESAAGSAAGIQGTPGSIIISKNGKKDFINGALPVDQIKAQIDKLLQ